MVHGINKKLICLIYIGEVAKQVYANNLSIHMGNSSKTQEAAMLKNRREICLVRKHFVGSVSLSFTLYHFLLHC